MCRYQEALISLAHELETQQLPLNTNIILMTKSMCQLEATTAALSSGIKLKASDSVEAFSGMREQLQEVLLNGEAALEIAASAAHQHVPQLSLSCKAVKQFQNLRIRTKQSAQSSCVTAVSSMRSSPDVYMPSLGSPYRQGAAVAVGSSRRAAAAARSANYAPSSCNPRGELRGSSPGYQRATDSLCCCSSPGMKLQSIGLNAPGEPPASGPGVLQSRDQLKMQGSASSSAGLACASASDMTQGPSCSGAGAASGTAEASAGVRTGATAALVGSSSREGWSDTRGPSMGEHHGKQPPHMTSGHLIHAQTCPGSILSRKVPAFDQSCQQQQQAMDDMHHVSFSFPGAVCTPKQRPWTHSKQPLASWMCVEGQQLEIKM